MMRSLYSGVAGLKTHQTKMDVIGNNISNVNTVAFKSSSTTFQDLMYQTTQAASGATANKGGTNAKQIGLGVTNGATKVSITSAGAAQSTGDAFDIRLTDTKTTNFFVVNNGSENVYTRAGAFYIDGTGNLAMTTTGYLVQGWSVDPNSPTGELSQELGALRIMAKENLTSSPEFTTNATFSGVLDKNDTDVTSTTGYYRSLTFYDNLGYAYNAKFAFKAKDTDEGLYTVELDSIIDSNGKDIYAEYINETDAAGVPVRKPSEVFGIYNAESIKHGLKGGVVLSEYKIDSAKADPTEMITIKVDGDTYVCDPKNADALAFTRNNPGVDPAQYDASQLRGLTFNKLESQQDPTTKETYFTLGDAMTFQLTDVYDIDTDLLQVGGTEPNTYYYVSVTDANGAAPADVDAARNIITSKREKQEPALGAETPDVFYFNGSDLTSLVRSTDAYSYDVKFSTRDGSIESVNENNANTAILAIGKFPLDGLVDAFSDITLDFNNMLNYDNGGSSTVQLERGAIDGVTGTGKKLGNMTGCSVDTSGFVWGSYDNGNTVLLGQIAVAQFSNASGLEEMGANCYKETLNSGEANITTVSADGSSMNTGQLEMSNVDLSGEFTDMIVTQRGFQANSRIITVSDTLLEELINLKR